MDRLVYFFVLSAVALSLHRAQCQNMQCVDVADNTFEFMFMTSFSESLNTSGNAVGMMIALEKINANSSILPGYNLTYSAIVDTQCNRSTSLQRFIESIRDPCSRFIAIMGAGCSVASEPVAEILHYWGLSQVSYASNSAVFRNERDFPQYAQLYPSEENFSPRIAEGIISFGWRQVAVITQRATLFTSVYEALADELRDSNVVILDSATIDKADNVTTLPNVFPETGHIFFINTYEDKAREILCEAYHRGLYGRSYLWLVYGWYDIDWWRVRAVGVVGRCSVEDMDEVIEGAIVVQQLPINSDPDAEAVGGISYNQYQAEYAQKREAYNFNSVTTSHIAYDATWVLAFAFDRANTRLKEEDLGNCSDRVVVDSLENWSYTRNGTMSCLVYEEILEVDFEGLSGNVRFDKNATRLNLPIKFLQRRNGELVTVILSDSNGSTYFVDGQSIETLFPYGIPPDGTPEVNIQSHHPALIALVYLLATIGLCFSAVCFFLIVFFRNKTVIILSTSVLNYCLILGVSMVLISLIFRVHPSNDPDVILAMCYISLWLFNIGYVLAFSAILTKMGRIYYVFFYPSKQKLELTNLHLLIIVATTTSVVIAMLVLGSAIPTTRLSTRLVNDLTFSTTIDENGVQQVFMYYQCYNSSSDIWLLFMYIYVGLLQIAAVVLVIQTRSVKIRVINDSKTVAAIIYVTSVATVVLVIVSFAFPDYQDISDGVYSLAVIFAAYSILLFTFIPKMYYLYKDPDGVEIFDHPKNDSKVDLNKKGVLKITNDTTTIDELYKQVDKLETALEDKKSMTDSQVVKLNNDNDTVVYTKNQSSDIDISISMVEDKQNGSVTTITGDRGSILEVIRNSTHSAESTVELVENNGEVNNHDLV